MRSKILIAMLVAVFFVLGVAAELTAQKPAPPSGTAPANFDIVTNLQGVQAQLAALSTDAQSTNKQITAKLDQVLANQQKILDELAIVKVRATHK